MFEDYATGMGSAYDEMYDGSALRTPYSELQPSLREMGQVELQSRVEALQSSYLDQGVTFDIGGEERAFPLDVLPRVIEMEHWAKVEAGVQQRVHTLEKFLADVYDAGRVLDDGVVPAAWSPPPRTSTARPPASSRPTACACTSAAST